MNQNKKIYSKLTMRMTMMINLFFPLGKISKNFYFLNQLTIPQMKSICLHGMTES